MFKNTSMNNTYGNNNRYFIFKVADKTNDFFFDKLQIKTGLNKH